MKMMPVIEVKGEGVLSSKALDSIRFMKDVHSRGAAP